MITGYQGFFNSAQNVTIANGAQLSSEINTGGMALVGLYLPAALTGTAITFQASSTSGGTYLDVYNSAGQVSYTVAPSRYIAIDPKDFQGMIYLKLKSGSAEGAARTITVSLKGL
jgi:hypothetical protein